MALRRSLCLAWQMPRCKPSKPGRLWHAAVLLPGMPSQRANGTGGHVQIPVSNGSQFKANVKKIQKMFFGLHFLLEWMGQRQRSRSVSSVANVKVMRTERFFLNLFFGWGWVATFGIGRFCMVACLRFHMGPRPPGRSHALFGFSWPKFERFQVCGNGGSGDLSHWFRQDPHATTCRQAVTCQLRL